MFLEIVSYNGFNINDVANFISWFPHGQPVMPNADAEWAPRAHNFAKLAGKEIKHTTMTIHIECKGTIHSQLDSLKGLFKINDFTPRQLIVQETSSSTTPGKQWYVEGYPVSAVMPPESGAGVYTVELAIDEPLWRSVSNNSDAWSITASNQTRNLSVGGNVYARPIIDIKPTTARAGGYGFKRFVAVVNRTSKQYIDAINLVNGNWDTAALVSASKMQADGDDLRVFYDVSGQEIFRWFGGGGINTTTTRVFVNAFLPPKISLTLNGSIASSGAVATISVKNTSANKTALKLLAAEPYKVLVIDMGGGAQEIFTYTATSISGLQITGTTRAQKLSSMQAHSDGATIYHVSAGYFVMYGNASASAPTTDDAFKPMFDMANSTNTSHVYADFWDPDNPNRLGQFLPEVLQNTGKESEIYTATQYAFSTGVASVMGMAIVTYLVGTTYRSPTAHLSWSLAHPAGFTTVTASGNKRRQGGSFPAFAGLRVKSGASYKNIWTDASPTAEDTWQALAAHSAVSLGGTYGAVFFQFKGSIGALHEYAAIEYDSVTLALDANFTPLFSFGAENNNNFMELRITNNTNGRWLEINYTVALNDHIIVDTDQLECYLQSDGTRIPIVLDNESQSEWLPFEPGVTNQLQYTETGVVAVTLTSTWEDRHTL